MHCIFHVLSYGYNPSFTAKVQELILVEQQDDELHNGTRGKGTIFWMNTSEAIITGIPCTQHLHGGWDQKENNMSLLESSVSEGAPSSLYTSKHTFAECNYRTFSLFK
jgi:hypothetical protein